MFKMEYRNTEMVTVYTSFVMLKVRLDMNDQKEHDLLYIVRSTKKITQQYIVSVLIKHINMIEVRSILQDEKKKRENQTEEMYLN